MKDDQYEDLIKRMRNIKPRPISSDKLTGQIIKSLRTDTGSTSHFIPIEVEDKHWPAFKGIRLFLGAVAVLLIGLYISQSLENLQDIPVLKKNKKEVFMQIPFPNNSYDTDSKFSKKTSFNKILNQFKAQQFKNKKKYQLLLDYYKNH